MIAVMVPALTLIALAAMLGVEIAWLSGSFSRH
jgi:hypothetical protein